MDKNHGKLPGMNLSALSLCALGPLVRPFPNSRLELVVGKVKI